MEVVLIHDLRNCRGLRFFSYVPRQKKNYYFIDCFTTHLSYIQKTLRKITVDRDMTGKYAMEIFNCKREWFSHSKVKGHYATSRKVAGSIPDEVIGFFKWPNPSSRTMALGSTEPLTEISTRYLLGGKERAAGKADDLTAICEPIV
jgi:hypothetical protein